VVPAEHCTKRIVKTLKWREEVVPNPLVCSACAKNYGSHYLHHVGFDKLGRPVLYSVFNLAEDHGLETNTQHMVRGGERPSTRPSPTGYEC
jgi:hypothetical protein